MAIQTLRPVETEQPLKERLRAFIAAVLQDSRINKSFHPVILNLATNFLKQVNDDEIRSGLNEVRQKVIPWLLGEGPSEDTHSE